MAENTAGSRSHFIGIIRLIVFIILIAVAVFFLVLFIENRRSDKTATELTQLSQSEKKEDGSSSTEKKEAESKETEDSKSKETEDSTSVAKDSKKESESGKTKEDSSQTITVPGGIDDASPKDSPADSGTDKTGPSAPQKNTNGANMPEAGMGTEVLIMAAFLSVATYGIVWRRTALQTIKSK